MKKILLKISGELFLNKDGGSFDFNKYQDVALSIAKFAEKFECQLAVVIGAGNVWRYRDTKEFKLSRVDADRLGMLATCFNIKILTEKLKEVGCKAGCFTDFPVLGLMSSYSAEKVLNSMESGNICLLAGGTGRPFFTTDSAAVLRACELGCDLVAKATMVDGVYDCDPLKNPKAVRFDKITYDEVLARSLQVMDLTAIALARDNSIAVKVFDFTDHSSLLKLFDDDFGTLITT